MTTNDYDYPVAELEAALRQAFVDNGADYIVLESRRERFLYQSAGYGQEMGWLGDYEEVGSDEQSLVWVFRLTEEGKRHFGLIGPVSSAE